MPCAQNRIESIKHCNQIFFRRNFQQLSCETAIIWCLVGFYCLIACIRSAHVHGGSNIGRKFDGCAGVPTSNASSIGANSSTGSCCTQRRPDEEANFVATFSNMKHISIKLPIAWVSIGAVHEDVTFEFANSGFCERLVFEGASENASMSSTLLTGRSASWILPLFHGECQVETTHANWWILQDKTVSICAWLQSLQCLRVSSHRKPIMDDCFTGQPPGNAIPIPAAPAKILAWNPSVRCRGDTHHCTARFEGF